MFYENLKKSDAVTAIVDGYSMEVGKERIVGCQCSA